MGTITAPEGLVSSEPIAPASTPTPLYDGLVIERGFNPDDMFTLPETPWETIDKRRKGKLMRDTNKIWDGIETEVVSNGDGETLRVLAFLATDNREDSV